MCSTARAAPSTRSGKERRGEYLGEEHTVRHLRDVTWFPTLTNRQRWDNWMAEGGRDMRQRGIEKARMILAEHRPNYLDPKTEAELTRMARTMQAQEIEAVRSGRVVYEEGLARTGRQPVLTAPPTAPILYSIICTGARSGGHACRSGFKGSYAVERR